MGRILSMDYQNRTLICESFKQLNYQTKHLDRILLKAINKADTVYAFRSYTHILEKNNLIKWLDSIELDKYSELSINFVSRNRVNKITAEGKEKIYCLNLDEQNKSKFLELFKVSIRDFKNILSSQSLKNPLYIDDPLYDQYDFVFVYQDNVVLWTDIHPFLFFLNERMI